MKEVRGRTQADYDIIRMCKYITDDRFIASYLGADLKRVVYLRGQMQKLEEKRSKAEKHRDFQITWNNDAERKAAIDARNGSAKLLKALVAFSANRQARINEGQSA
jgi:hypothetical protein